MSENPKFPEGLVETVEGLYNNENFRDLKTIAELVESRTKDSYQLKPDTTMVATVIDYLTKTGKIKEAKPPVDPSLVAGLPPEQPVVTHQEHASSTGQNTASQPSSIGQDTATEASSQPEDGKEDTQQDEMPTAAVLLEYLQPILKTGIGVTELRRKMGHEKGKAWTALFNEILDTILRLRNTRTPNQKIYEDMQKTYGIQLVV